MSNYAITWAFEIQIQNPTHKLVLIALADFADAAGESYPSQEMLAWRACTSVRTVQRALNVLEDTAWSGPTRSIDCFFRSKLRRRRSR
jgi:hypothetical protein